MIVLKRDVMVVRNATPADREWIANLLRERWHGTQIAAHGEISMPSSCHHLLWTIDVASRPGGGSAATPN